MALDPITVFIISGILALAGAAGITRYYVKTKKFPIKIILALLFITAIMLAILVPIILQVM